MAAHLPDLLEALAHLLARPGTFPLEVLRACQQATWLPEGAATPLQALLEAQGTDLAVAYAGHFLVGAEHPTLHLEEGAQRLGRLADPGLESELSTAYATWAFCPTGPAEHLATQFEALAVLLRRLAQTPDPREEAVLRAGLNLLDAHTLPFLAHLRATRIDGPYGAALDLGGCLLAEVRLGLKALLQEN